jgi:uncharacterized protein
MTYDRDVSVITGPRAPETVDIDIGLRQYMLRVYNFMAAGLSISGLVAYLVLPRSRERRLSGS